jgi:aminoglycoside phosphotransferase (APT) family kinase protein
VAAQNMPAAEVDITEDLVRRLLVAQHPDLADLPLAAVAHGWDNAVLRLGTDLAVRLPRRQQGADLVEHEQRLLPDLARHLPIEIPSPVRLGVPDDQYPWRWSICPWFDGDLAADVPLEDPLGDAQRLGEFVAAMHAFSAERPPVNPFRGQPVAQLRPRVVTNIERLGTMIDGAATTAWFDRVADVEEWHGDPLWVHGDLHSANVVVRDGSISAVIDFGDITAADPAVDLPVAWMLFDDAAMEIFRSAAGAIDDATWDRGRAWAMHFALLYLLHSADSERFARMGTNLFARLVDS